jgi:hypothetical protein
MLNEVQAFWSGMRMAVMNRQPGLTWEDVGRMPVTYFFHVLKLSEKSSGDTGDQKVSRALRRKQE